MKLRKRITNYVSATYVIASKSLNLVQAALQAYKETLSKVSLFCFLALYKPFTSLLFRLTGFLPYLCSMIKI